MTPDCLFCDNPAGSKEHLWAAWIHKREDFGPLKLNIGNSPQETGNDPEQKIDTVWSDCNNGLRTSHAGMTGLCSQLSLAPYAAFQTRADLSGC